MQNALGADIIMAFDECAPGGSSKEYARAAMERTHRWAVRSKEQWQKIVTNANKAGARTCEYLGAMEAFKHLSNSIFD